MVDNVPRRPKGEGVWLGPRLPATGFFLKVPEFRLNGGVVEVNGNTFLVLPRENRRVLGLNNNFNKGPAVLENSPLIPAEEELLLGAKFANDSNELFRENFHTHRGTVFVWINLEGNLWACRGSNFLGLEVSGSAAK